MAGIKYGIISRDYPVYLYLGAGYGDDGSQRSNGKKKGKGRIEYYDNYTNGFESEIGASFILFDFLSISMGADAIFGHRVAFNINCTIGFAVDLTMCIDIRMRVCEKEIGTIEPRTMPTLQALQEDCPDANLYFVMGADKLKLLTHLTRKRYYVQRATDPDIACLQFDERRKRGYTLKAMGAALWALWHPVDFTEGLVTVVNEGGDADSNGAPAGAVLGARLGYCEIPVEYTEGLNRYKDLKRIFE